MGTTAEMVESLRGKDNQLAYDSLRALMALSENSAEVYAYMDAFASMMESDNSYLRTRGLLLMVANARWDEDNRIDEVIDALLTHVDDVKPITARQCIQSLPELAKFKPELREDIVNALRNAKTFRYPGTMQPLIQKDIANALHRIDTELA